MHPLRQPLAPLRIRMAGGAYTIIDEHWAYPMHAPWWRIYRNREAGAWLDIKGRRLSLPAGRVIVVPPWCSARSGCQGRIHHLFLHAQIEGQEAWLPAGLSPLILSESAEINTIADRCEDPSAAPWWPDALGRIALAHVFDALPSAVRMRLRAALDGPDDLAPAVELAQRQLHLPLAVPDLAAACNMSEDSLARRFRHRLGCTPAAWLTRLRIGRAAEMLESDDASIDHVASHCGYTDRAAFSRAFARVMGLGPAAHRRQARAWLP